RRAPLQRLDVAETERLERRQVETADGPGDVAEGVRALVAEVGCIRQLARTDGVQNDDARARHYRGLSYSRGNGARTRRHRGLHRIRGRARGSRDVARREDQ